MNLNFLSGQPEQNPAGFSWMNPNQQNFQSPAMQYQPNMGMNAGIGMSGMTTDSTPMSSMFSGAGSQLGMNIPTFQLGLGALGSLANIYGGFQANKLAKDQLNFTKDITNTNLNNSIKSYNTQLEDRARSRAAAENRDQSTADAYVEKNKISR